MITAKTYATRCGRCTAGSGATDCDDAGGCAAAGWGGAAKNAGDSCGGGHLGSTLDMRQGFEVAVHVPGGEGGCDTTYFARHMIRHLTRLGPAALEQGTKQGQAFGSGPRCSSRAASLAHAPA